MDPGADIGGLGLTFVCTDPAYQGRGAGSLLSRKVLEMAAADGMPVYLESTEVAVPMYEKLGFRVIDGFEMQIPRPGLAELTEVYREACMVWYPPSKQGDRSG
jgi:ribosomal protein S18 acetylase RimI-like enzyme